MPFNEIYSMSYCAFKLKSPDSSDHLYQILAKIDINSGKTEEGNGLSRVIKC